MALNKEIASALERVYEVTKRNEGNILATSDILRADRELLVRTKWLLEIIKGWYMLVRPDSISGDTTLWYANFWVFLRIYLEHLYDKDYCLSAEHSLEMHIGESTIPKQVVVITSRGGGKPQELPFDTSIYPYCAPSALPEERATIQGIQVMTLPYALCKITPINFKKYPQNMEIALRSIASPSHLVQVIVKYKFKQAAARLIGAYRFLKDEHMAETLENDLAEAGIVVKPENPFERSEPTLTAKRGRSPYSHRIVSMWNSYRQLVIDHFSTPPGLPRNKEKYVRALEEVYTQDAYNSLSIEGYDVDNDLIERVKNHKWHPDLDPNDRNTRNVLAARGYFEAYQVVKTSIAKILEGANPGRVVQQDLQKWYRALFAPSTRAGIIPQEDLYGYRKAAVYIRNSRHVPLPRESLVDVMETFFTCLEDESHPAVRAVLGHFIFVFIHPYMDGNGRIGRFILNAMLASGGYPWTVIKVAHRTLYLHSLETASVDKDIIPFVQFVAKEMGSF